MYCYGEQRMTIAQTNVWFFLNPAKRNSNQTTVLTSSVENLLCTAITETRGLMLKRWQTNSKIFTSNHHSWSETLNSLTRMRHKYAVCGTSFNYQLFIQFFHFFEYHRDTHTGRNYANHDKINNRLKARKVNPAPNTRLRRKVVDYATKKKLHMPSKVNHQRIKVKACKMVISSFL